ncbi:hypothetical protein RhiJN_18110 [Ceratobasidium sp. AG-Ba]|nr:hypothetical protein RhiJN_18110 [Ceratobasidium sp. AG-Ba]
MSDTDDAVLLPRTTSHDRLAAESHLERRAKHFWQTPPPDILVIIFQLLSTTIHTPLLWSHIDVCRGKPLTDLWLTRSGDALLDVRLSEDPRDLMSRYPFTKFPQDVEEAIELESTPVIEGVLAQSHRWRSLDIAYFLVNSIFRALNLLRGPLEKTLHLDSLTIGVMYRGLPIGTCIVEDIFEADCRVLRVNAYCTSAFLFSSRLTEIEMFTGACCNHYDDVELDSWAALLSRTPNLVRLKLVNPRHRLASREIDAVPIHSPIKLSALQSLELSGAFVILANLFSTASFPKLESLVLNQQKMPHPLDDHLFALLSGLRTLERLGLSSGSVYWFISPLHAHLRLRELTLFEIDWEHVVAALGWLSESENRPQIYLSRIWDIKPSQLEDLGDCLRKLPPIKLEECYFQGEDECDGSCDGVYKCKLESNYSDNSSFSRPSLASEFASSEETGSDESARSYGVDDGPYVRYSEVVF